MVNYFVAVIVAAAQISPNGGFVGPFQAADMWAVGMLTGFIFIGTFFLYGYCVDINGVALSLAAMRMSLAIPIGVSVFFFQEEVSVKSILAIALVFVALLLMIPKAQANDKNTRLAKADMYRSGLILFLLFVLAGFGDSSLKLFERYFMERAREEMFMALVFSGAFLMSLIISSQSGSLMPKPFELLFGVLVGVPNLYSSIFVIQALTQMPASQVFSLVNIIIVVLGALSGWLIWKDRLQPRQIAGLLFGIIASYLLAYV
jgi:drug/metabolite transporter (DMT)-like permease